MLPASALFMILYAKLSNNLSKKALFYVTCTPFFIFYALFCTVIYPNRHLLMPNVRMTAVDFGARSVRPSILISDLNTPQPPTD